MQRLILFAFLAIFALPASAAKELTTVDSLAAAGEKARAEGKPVVVFFFQKQCHYCETVRHQFLLPISGNASYQERIILRQLNTRAHATMRDFDGEKLSQARFASREDKRFTPTVAFYGPDGEQLAEPLIGLKGGRDYYGHYLDKGIAEAEAALEE
ncbi:MAG TPA: thioredoxin family protein [Gammaproteobacteria bacterium]|nr:thioredoxin family protein [Gammaproteobacteria bacterium]